MCARLATTTPTMNGPQMESDARDAMGSSANGTSGQSLGTLTTFTFSCARIAAGCMAVNPFLQVKKFLGFLAPPLMESVLSRGKVSLTRATLAP